jgi:hypothetical protein
VGTHDASQYNGPELGRDPLPSVSLTPGYASQPDVSKGNNGNSALGGNATKRLRAGFSTFFPARSGRVGGLYVWFRSPAGQIDTKLT